MKLTAVQRIYSHFYPELLLQFCDTEAKRCFATHDEDNDYFNMRIYIYILF